MGTKQFKLPEKERLSDGMTVPAGYFSTFAQRMEGKLPYNEAAETGKAMPVQRRTWWQKSRPYIYMAAMFMGVWCMTKMFSLMKENSNPFSLDNNSVLTAALSNNDFVDDYVLNSMDEYDILNSLYEEGVDLNDFQN